MRSGKCASLFLAIIGLLYSCSNDEDSTTIIPVDQNQIDIETLVEGAYDDYLAEYPGFPGSYAIQVISPEGEYFAQKGFDAELTVRHRYRAQSTTKTFTAAGIMILHQRGLLDFRHIITDTIPGQGKPYVPASPKYNIPHKDEISIADILRHRAGIYDIANYPVNGEMWIEAVLDTNPTYTFCCDDLFQVISDNQLSFCSPGEAYHYSNEGYVLLSYIIERVSGKSYAAFIQDEILEPLELTDSSFPIDGSDQIIPSPFIDTWYWAGGQSINATEENMTANVGEGNLISSTRDLSKFYRLLLNGQAGVDMMYVTNYMMNCVPVNPETTQAYGLGLQYFEGLGYGHGGDGGGITVRCFTDPQNDITILAFFNCWNFQDGPGNWSYFMDQQSLLYNMMYEAKEIVR